MVVPVQSKRDNKTYYRLQMGTTSQAHSVVLCQQLRMIGQSCIVTGRSGREDGGMNDQRSPSGRPAVPWLQAVEDEEEPRGVSAGADVRVPYCRAGRRGARRRELLLARADEHGRRGPARTDPGAAGSLQGAPGPIPAGSTSAARAAPRSRPAPARTAIRGSTSMRCPSSRWPSRTEEPQAPAAQRDPRAASAARHAASRSRAGQRHPARRVPEPGPGRARVELRCPRASRRSRR